MAYYKDVNNYVVVKTSKIQDYGASTGNSDNFTEIQNAINSDYRVVFIGEVGETYTISQPLYLKSNKTYIINGTIIVANGSTANLTANITAGANSFTVDSVTGFAIGQWISVTDNNALQVYSTYRGWSGRIENITGLTITLDNVSPYSYTTAANGRVGHTQGVIYAPIKTNILIDGVGVLDGNRYNQSQFHPVYGAGAAEDQRATSTLSIWKSSYITVNNITITKGILHSFVITSDTPSVKSNNITCNGIKATYGHDKSCLTRNTDIATFNNCTFEDATWEDGNMMYSGCTNITMNNPISNRNKRYGIGVNLADTSNNYTITINNPITRDNYEHGLYVAGKFVTINNADCNDPFWFAGSYDGKDNVINGITINGCITTEHINARGVFYLHDNITNCTINDMVMINCNGIGIKSLNVGADYPTRIEFVGGGIYNHTGTKTSIAVGSDITFENFEGL